MPDYNSLNRDLADTAERERQAAEAELRRDQNLRETLLALYESADPIGARTIMRRIGDGSAPVSESTTNRLLKRLDVLGLTYTTDRKGRRLSSRGRAAAERLALFDARAEGLDALAVDSLERLRETLVARRGLEREIVRAVVHNATDTELTRIDDILSGRGAALEYDKHAAPGTHFHRALPILTRNRSLRALGLILLDDNGHEHERLLDVVTASSGGKGTSRQEHRAILDAIVRRDTATAEAEMVRHLDRLIVATDAPMSQPAWLAFTVPAQG